MTQTSIIAVTDTGQQVIVGPVQTDDSLTRLSGEVREYGWSVQATVPVLSASAFRGSVARYEPPIETASSWLVEQGFVIRELGWNCPGEGVADVIAWRDGTVLVGQVRRRLPGMERATALDAVDRTRLWRIALHWLYAQRIPPDGIRIDYLIVTATSAGPGIQHIPAERPYRRNNSR